ncbi:MAG TPA: hypothetical protein DDW52_10205 [Planctomycetaceae bacterium]|nr:hypothetical protein [Planctomycetaceae bacterium]
MDAFDAAKRAFIACKSRNPDKNEACAPFLAGEYLKQSGMPAQEREELMEFAHRLLNEWYQRKAANPNFEPSREDYQEEVVEQE